MSTQKKAATLSVAKKTATVAKKTAINVVKSGVKNVAKKPPLTELSVNRLNQHSSGLQPLFNSLFN